MESWKCAEGPDQQQDYEDAIDAGHGAVRELDQGLTLGDCGSTSPLQSGQWLPHPAPAPLART